MATQYKIKYGDTLTSIAKANGTTVDAIAKANGISDPNKIYAGRTLTIEPPTPTVVPAAQTQTNTPAATPATPTAPSTDASGTPTIKQAATSVVPDYIPDATFEAAKKKYADIANSTVDEEAVRKQIRDRMQAEIDAINQVYAQKYSEAKVAGEGRRGSARAASARGGLLGSDFGNAIDNNVVDQNNQILASIDAEKAAKIGEIMSAAENSATAEITAKRTAIQQGAEEYLKYLTESEARKTTAISNVAKLLIAKGLNPNDLSQADLDKLSASYGTDIGSLTAAYNKEKQTQDSAAAALSKDQAAAKKAEADAASAANDINSFNLTDGTQRYVYDPKTGEAKLIATNKKEFAPNKYSAGGSGSGSGGSGSGSGTSKGLTYDDPNYTLEAIRGSKGGRALTQGELKPITDIQQVVGQAETLTGLINSVDTGPFLGIIRSNNPYDTKAQQMKAAITAIVPKLARGVYGEVGVLTDQDIANYSRTIANLKSTPDVNKAVMAMTLDIATRSLANQLNSQAAGGRDVSKFEAIYNGMISKATKLKTELGVNTQTPAATTTNEPTVKVKNPQTGQVGTIPQSNLQKALAKGYVVVQ